MTLATLQHTMKDLFLSREGREALASEESLRQFLENADLSQAEREALTDQPLLRLRQYAFMVRANVEETLKSIYPFSHRLLQEQWPTLSETYLCAHPNPSYRLMEAARMFPDFLASLAQDFCQAFPWLPDLARYEWEEARLLSAPDPIYPDSLHPKVPKTAEALVQWCPVLNPTAALLTLYHPIPQMIEQIKQTPPEHSPVFEVMSAQPVFIWIYRTPYPFTCRFFQLNPILAVWLSEIQALQEHGTPQTYQAVSEWLLEQLRPDNPALTLDFLNQQLLTILPVLYDKGILVGSIPADDD